MEKQTYRRVIDRIAPEAALIEKTEALMRSAADRRRPIKGMRVAAAIALALVLLAGVALASGKLEFVFSGQTSLIAPEGTAPQYEQFTQWATQDIMRSEIAFEGVEDNFIFAVNAAYYDGESLALNIVWEKPAHPASFDFGSEHPLFGRLGKEYGSDIAFLLPDSLTPAEYERYKAALKSDIRCGIIYDAYFLTNADNEGFSDIALYNGSFFAYNAFSVRDDDPSMLVPTVISEGNMDDGSKWCYLEFSSPLPEYMRDQDEIDVSFKLIRMPVYYYADGTGCYCYPGTDTDGYQEVPVTVSVRRSDPQTMATAP